MDFNLHEIFNEEKNVWEIKASGEIDIYNSAALRNTLNSLLEKKCTDVYIDCEDLEYIDSTGLGALVAVLKNVKEHEKELHLLKVRSNVLKLFKITDLDKIFVIEEES